MIKVTVVEDLTSRTWDMLYENKQAKKELYKEELVFGTRFRIEQDFTRTTWFKSPSSPLDDFETGKLNFNITFVSLASSSPVGRPTFFAYCFEKDKILQIPLWDSTLVYYGI